MKTLPLLFLFLLAGALARGSTLPPELKAYDFAQAYYIEDGGIVIVPYPYGFSCAKYVSTPEGLRVMPGGTFSQYDPQHQVDQEFLFRRLSADGTQAYFHERVYQCRAVTAANGRPAHVQVRLLGTNDFYLSQFRDLEWFDFVFGNIQMHPGLGGMAEQKLAVSGPAGRVLGRRGARVKKLGRRCPARR